jgi:hypothetical protein
MLSMASDLLHALLDAMDERLRQIGGRLDDRADLTQVAFQNAVSIARGAAVPATRMAVRAFPLPHIILLCELTFQEDGTPLLDPMLWWVSLVRQRLNMHERADLHVIVAAIDERIPARRGWYSRIETDDRLCRKLVFAPKTAASARSEATTFLDRTFFARPWNSMGTSTARSLDPMLATAARFTSATSVSLDEARAWLSVLSRDLEDPRDLSTLLLTSLGDDDV